jgi:hypothetical protein
MLSGWPDRSDANSLTTLEIESDVNENGQLRVDLKDAGRCPLHHAYAWHADNRSATKATDTQINSGAAGRRNGQIEQAEQFWAGEHVLEVERYFVDDALEQPPFAEQKRFDPLLNRLLASIGVDIHRVSLAQPMATILGLALDRRVPPPVEVEHVRRILQIEPHAPGT